MTISKKVKLSLITIPQAEKNGDSRLFVLNRSNPSGNVNITATGDDGQKTTVVIPTTFIPFDMSYHIGKERLLATPAFRKLVAAGFIALVDPEEAAKFIESSDKAQAEQKRLLSLFGSDHTNILGMSHIEIDDRGNSNRDVPTEQSLAATPFIMAIIERAHEEDIADLLVELDSKQHTLSDADVEYLHLNAKAPELKAWAAEWLES